MCLKTDIAMSCDIIAPDNECYICFDNNKSDTFKCRKCQNSICNKCFYQLSRDVYNPITKRMDMSLKCPTCRCDAIYSYEDFEKDEIIYLVNNHIKQLHSFFKERDELRKEILDNQKKVDLLESKKNILEYKLNGYSKINEYVYNRKTKYIPKTAIQKLINDF